MAAVGAPWDIRLGTTNKSLKTSISDKLSRRYSERGFSDTFRERVEKLSSSIKESSTYRNAIAAFRKLRHSRKDNTVRRLSGIGELQQAPRVMERFLVANPVVRRAYNQRMVAGYEDGFSKLDKWRGTAIKHTDKAYQMVMNGRTDEEELLCHTYALTREEETTLSEAECIDITVSWKNQLKAMAETTDDITSRYNAVRG